MAEDEQDRAGQIQLRRLQGTMLGEAYGEMIDRVLNESEDIDWREWVKLSHKWLTRQETVEAFDQVLEWMHRDNVDPSSSAMFKASFRRMSAVDQKILLLEKLRDPIMYAAFVLAGRKSGRAEARTPSDIGL